MRAVESWHRYILLPEEGAISPSGAAADLLGKLPRTRSMGESESIPLGVADGREVTVVDTAMPDGPRLVEADFKIAEMVNRGDSPLQMVPIVQFAPPDPPLEAHGGSAPAGDEAMPAPTVQVEVHCTDASTGEGIGGARIVAFNNYAYRIGNEGKTDATGKATVMLWSPTIQRLIVEPPKTGPAYWGGFRHSLDASSPIAVSLTPVDLSYVDSVRHYYGNSKFDVERGVEVGVIDTGVGPHSDLNVISGVNTVTKEPADDYLDPRGHGTHVAGLIGSGGAPPTGLRGLAPGARLRAYRVFPKPSSDPGAEDGATNYSILKAMAAAAADGCDVINLSLGGGPHDPTVERAVIDARNAGMLVVVSAGNDYRYPASFPSVYPEATAVTAMGRRGTFPAGSLEESKVAQLPIGDDPAEFLASFSSVGQEVAVTGPGVGDLSTMPGDRFAPMNGTSMAAPVVSGAVACLLSQSAGVFAMARDGARSQAIEKLLTDSCEPRGFGAIYEGKGMPSPAIV